MRVPSKPAPSPAARRAARIAHSIYSVARMAADTPEALARAEYRYSQFLGGLLTIDELRELA